MAWPRDLKNVTRRGLNLTELWMVKEQMDAGLCSMDSDSHTRDIIEFTVTTPGGDRYYFTEVFENICSVAKVEEDVV